MKNIAILIAILSGILCFAQFASAASYSIEYSQEGNKVLVKESILFDEETISTIQIPEDASSISANLNYNISNGNIIIKGKEIKLSYITSHFLEKTNEGYYFVNNVKFNSNFSEAKVKVILKEGYYLEKTEIFPSNYTLETDGKQISVIWLLKDRKAGEDFPIFILIMDTNHNSGLIYYFIVVLAIVIIAIIARFSLLRKKSHNKLIEHHLIDSEKKVLESLKKSDRQELWQKQLQIETGFSKAKLSRVIRNLESRKLIKKIPFGNTNKISLS